MPRRALRCVVELELSRVSAPGVWLPMREDCYISICLFGQYRTTRDLTSVFPLCVYQPFRFEKTYYTALDPSDVAVFLEDELVVFELLQYRDYGPGAIRLASYSCNARDFLFPYPSLCPSYTSSSREILLSRTIAFPGIAPKLEFSTKTVIQESRSPELDALEDALQEEQLARRARSRSRSRSRARSRSRSRTRTVSDTLHISITPRSGYLSSDSENDGWESDPSYMRPTISSVLHSRSKSGVRTSDESLSDTDGGKAPFVVRHLEKSLIGRTPGAPPTKAQTIKKKRRSRSLTRPSSALSGYASYDDSPRSYTPRSSQVIRDSGRTTPVYTPKYISDSEDEEVAALTSTRRSLPIIPRPRSASPYIYKPSYSARFSPAPLYLTASERVELEIARAKARARARAYLRSRSPSPYRYSPVLRDSLDDLAIDTSIVKNRSWVHLDAGQYWTQRAAELSGTSHRDVFNNNVNRLYKGLYKNALNRNQK